MPTVTVIVPATDRPSTLDSCLDAVAAAGPDEVIVVQEPAGAGPAAARNAGAARAGGDVLLFVDSDVLIHPDVVERVRAAFAADEGLVALFGSYDNAVATEGEVAAFRNLLHHVVHQRSAGEVRSFWAGIGAVRRDAFAASGGFDADRYPVPSIEDIELGGRLADQGPILLDPALQGTHLKEWTLRSMVVTDVRRRGVPWVRLMLERGDVPATLNLGLRERASAVAAVAAVGALAFRRTGVAAAAVGTQVALNRDLYGLLLRRRGVRGATIGVGLHVVHQLAAAAALVVGLASSARSRRDGTP